MKTLRLCSKIFLLLGIVIILAGCQNSSDQETNTSSTTGEVKEFTMTAKQWEFIPDTITVNKGDKVRIVIDTIDVAHGIGIPDFNVAAILEPGKITTVEFIANKTGTFPFICSVYCGTGHGGMRGTVVVQ